MLQLRFWSSTKFGSVRNELEVLRKQPDQLRGKGDRDDSSMVRETMSKMDELLYREEMLWLQRSRIT
jgi:hypothetical protein